MTGAFCLFVRRDLNGLNVALRGHLDGDKKDTSKPVLSKSMLRDL